MTLVNEKGQGWWLAVGLVALSIVPLLAGGARVADTLWAENVTVETRRFHDAPAVIVAHILGSSVYAIAGAFQFVPALRWRAKAYHRGMGYVVISAGIASSLSGIWMTLTYDFLPMDNVWLYGTRLIVGGLMTVFLIAGLAMALVRDIPRHRAFMMRAYAMGLGAGTQVVLFLPYMLTVGMPEPGIRAFLMAAGWGVNLFVVEVWLAFRRTA